jgi:putative addiction module CopG family antidote
MTIELTTDLEELVREQMQTGNYKSEEDVLRAALGLLVERERLLAEIDAGAQQLESGDYTEYDDNSRERFLADIRREAEQISAARKGP